MSHEGPITVKQACQALGLKVCVAGTGMDTQIGGALISDLLSFVMANGKPEHCWITIQTHSNIVAVAVLGNLSAIIVASGFHPDEDTTGRAEEEGIPILTTEQSAYELAGKLYELGVR